MKKKDLVRLNEGIHSAGGENNVPHRGFVGGREMDCVGMGNFLGCVDSERTVMSLISGRISCISLITLSIIESSGLLICVCNKIIINKPNNRASITFEVTV